MSPPLNHMPPWATGVDLESGLFNMCVSQGASQQKQH